jgi:hypothetical protein
MGVPNHNENADGLAARVPPGIGDIKHNEARRIPERIAALTEQHETSWRSVQRHRPSLDQQAAIEVEFATAPSREQEAEFEEIPYSALMRTLDPVVMPPPPQDKRSLLSLGTVAGFSAAFCLAAGIALAMTNFMQIVNRAVASGADPAQSQSFSKTVLANLTQITPAQAVVESAGQPSTPALGPFAALRTNDAAPGQLQAATSPSAQPSIVVPQPAALPDPPASPILSPEETAASPEETAAMLQRGRDLIAAGDIANARLILEHIAEAGNAEASFILAGTFDPVVLSKLGAIGLRPDPAKARTLYAKAAEQGSPEARRQLQQSAPR